MFNVTLNGAVLLTGGLGTEVIREEAQLRGGQCGGQAISQQRGFCLAHIMGTCQADFWQKPRKIKRRKQKRWKTIDTFILFCCYWKQKTGSHRKF